MRHIGHAQESAIPPCQPPSVPPLPMMSTQTHLVLFTPFAATSLLVFRTVIIHWMSFEKCVPVLLRYYHPNTKLVPDLYNRIQHCLPSFKADFSCSSPPTLADSQYVYAIVVHFIYNLLRSTSMFRSMCVTKIRSSLKHWVGGTGQLLPCRRNISVMKMYPH